MRDRKKLSTNYGAAFTVGRSYYVNKNKPLARMIRFGIDATWIDLNYGNYSFEEAFDYDKVEKQTFHQAEIGMQVGPSITVSPVSKLNAHLYFRYNPSFAGLYDGDAFCGNYGSFFVSGISVSYGAIGLGIEKRWGSCKYKEFGGGSTEEEYDDGESGTPVSSKLKTSGLRAYLTFRF